MDSNNRKTLWITWEKHRRNREISKAIDTRIIEFAEIDAIKNIFKKYSLAIFKTLKILLREKPKLVYSQNPSIVLAMLMVLLKKISGFRVIVDAHNAGIFPREGESAVLNRISNFIHKNADLVIVTNTNLKNYIESIGGKAFILPDKIPSLIKTPLIKLKGRYNFLFICTFSADEPFKEVIEAARNLPEDIVIYISGNYKKAGLDPLNMPRNIVLCGFLPDNEYEQLLHSVDATLSLTFREDCLICSAYETVAAEKPMVLSKTVALSSYFDKGAIYTFNTAEHIANAIKELINSEEQLKQQMIELKQIKTEEWEKQKSDLLKIEQKLLNHQVWN